MSMFVLRWQDVSGMNRMENALGHLTDHEKYLALQRAVNHTGAKARTAVKRALAKQTGLNVSVIEEALKATKAYGASGQGMHSSPERPGSLEYVLRTRGGDISLKYFKARETRQGVTAAPFGQRRLFPGALMKGGHFPNRKTAKKLNGHVYEPVNPAPTGKTTWGRPLSFKDSGVIIPAEMVKGATADAFRTVVERDLPPRVMHEIMRIVPNVFT